MTEPADPMDYELEPIAVIDHIVNGEPKDLRPMSEARHGDIVLVTLSDAAHVVESRDRIIAHLRNELTRLRGNARYDASS